MIDEIPNAVSGSTEYGTDIPNDVITGSGVFQFVPSIYGDFITLEYSEVRRTTVIELSVKLQLGESVRFEFWLPNVSKCLFLCDINFRKTEFLAVAVTFSISMIYRRLFKAEKGSLLDGLHGLTQERVRSVTVPYDQLLVYLHSPTLSAHYIHLCYRLGTIFGLT
jgi:hypothetical protein